MCATPHHYIFLKGERADKQTQFAPTLKKKPKQNKDVYLKLERGRDPVAPPALGRG